MDLGKGFFQIFGGRITTSEDKVSEYNLFATTTGIPIGMMPDTETLTLSDSSHVAKHNIEQFWGLESLGIIDLLFKCDDDLAQFK